MEEKGHDNMQITEITLSRTSVAQTGTMVAGIGFQTKKSILMGRLL
jgi:hypothetical protein